MNKLRENDVVETGQINAESAKLPYEKPAIKAVSLFADQVLVNCMKADATCTSPGPIADS